MWRTILIFGGILAGAASGLQWLQYQLLARTHPGELYIVLLVISLVSAALLRNSRFLPAMATA